MVVNTTYYFNMLWGGMLQLFSNINNTGESLSFFVKVK